ncbi:MAG TPA: UDP-N-acetylmuramate--L-alanine ligase [Candidatus Pullichristensenella stercorigallinarum]|uniref:UDP-N-acetylmuramate--L-alanine ligase n=1 Tax=Candidatus Pullichristensenella stercorigallinarum TaxID=2840909 RepID=A0A9D1CX18_9FIRM|nr:UDP-N-acetylmuramate--L-alanine ligase [Candidatus Pullichristensenella stercorigallinarum]
MTDIRSVRRVHMIGVGGSSMSGLAGLLKDEGYEVTGSDRTRSHKTEALEARGVKVLIGHQAENVHGAQLVIYSAAIAADNPERAEAERLGIPQMERCDLIGQLMKGSECAIAVSGTHGKTTTTSMLAQAFLTAGHDPSVHIGGELDFLGGSTRRGKDEFILEACEYNRSFLHFYPTMAVILNIDEDHLDCYKDIDDIEHAFLQFARLSKYIVGWGDDMRVLRVIRESGLPHTTYGLGEGNTLRPEGLSFDERGRASFTAVWEGEPLGAFALGVPGQANLLDALATIAVAHLRGLSMDAVAEALSQFRGAHRRNELTSVTDGVKVFTDYGHNPAEIKSALEIAALEPHKTLWAVWQPHTYSRTKALFDQFLTTFDKADKVLVTDICAAREKDPGDIRSEMLIEPLRAHGVDAVLTPTFDDAEAYLRAHWQEGDVVITHGCGDIDLLNEQIALHGDTKPGK